MKRTKMTPLKSVAEVPADMTEGEARDFWDTHEVTEAYLQSAPPVVDPDLPSTRTTKTQIALPLSAETLRRIRALARKKGKGYQTLLKEFVIERLYEEEKREGLLNRASDA